MAKATAHCTCRVCGQEFIKTATKYNRDEANRWESWAEGHYDLCPSCWGKQQWEEEQKLPPTLTIQLLPFSPERPIYLTWSGNTMQVKDQIKTLGYKFGEIQDGGVFGFVSAHKPRKNWHMSTTPDALPEVLKAASTIPGVILKQNVSDADMIVARQEISKMNQKKTDLDSKISALGPKPERPSCWPDGKWNGKIYGNEKYGYRIYVDGDEKNIGPQTVKDLEKYQKDADEYRSAVEKIKRETE